MSEAINLPRSAIGGGNRFVLPDLTYQVLVQILADARRELHGADKNEKHPEQHGERLEHYGAHSDGPDGVRVYTDRSLESECGACDRAEGRNGVFPRKVGRSSSSRRSRREGPDDGENVYEHMLANAAHETHTSSSGSLKATACSGETARPHKHGVLCD